MTLASDALSQLPLLIHQPDHGDLGVRAREVHALGLLVDLDCEDGSLVLAEGLDVGQELPVVDVQASLVVAHEDPAVGDDLADGQLRVLVDDPHLLAEADDGGVGVEVVGRGGLAEVLVGEVVLREVPGHALLLVEGEHRLSGLPDCEQLRGEGVALPAVVAEELQLEGLEQRQNPVQLQEVQRRLQLRDLLQSRLRLLHADLIDLRVAGPRNVEPALFLIGKDGPDGCGVDANEIVEFDVDELLVRLSLHC